jgi:tetratricopeptide (TPR) repeat protein
MILVDEGYARGDGQFSFNRVPTGEYVIETDATDRFAASSTSITVIPLDLRRSEVFRVSIQLSLKPAAATAKPGVVMADVDLDVPKEAQKRYREGMKAQAAGSSERAISELQSALKLYPDYYAARLDLGRELRAHKRFEEAAKVLRPALKLAPKRAEPLIEYGVVLMALARRDEAVAAFSDALRLEETNWGPHLYLGMALLEKEKDEAERHLRRALELNESKASRAHLSLARLASGRGQRQLAIEHLQAYLTLTPDAPDAEPVRQLIERLRASK